MRRRELDSRLLILVTLALVAFGLVMVYSATSAAAAVGGNDPSYYLKRQGIYAALGIVLMTVAQRWDYRRLKALSPMLVLVSIVLLLAVLAIGPAINGARRWISLGPAVFQPSEFAKLSLAVWAASYLARRPAPRSLKELGRPVGALAGVYCVLLIVEPDLGTAIALMLMLAAMLLVAGTPIGVLGPAISLAGALGTAAIWLEPYRRARFFAFLHPWHDAQGTGFQIVQAMIGMGSGGIFGVGLGQGVQKIFYLPEAHTDMMLANIGEELGLLAVAEALTERDVFVTLAGSPDRVEARLVPDSGYELDTFRIEGFPRQPSFGLARALARAGAAPAVCRAILRRRRPDVVFGAGGFVAGPVVLAAASMRIPAALAEADAHLGLANRLALPFAKRVFLAYPLAGRHGSRYRVVGRPIPQRARPISQAG